MYKVKIESICGKCRFYIGGQPPTVANHKCQMGHAHKVFYCYYYKNKGVDYGTKYGLPPKKGQIDNEQTIYNTLNRGDNT